MEGINSNKIQFFKEKIKNRLAELKPYMSDVKYRMYTLMIEECKDLDELREMAEMDLQFNMIKYLNELTDKIKLSDTSIDELEAVINQNTKAAKLTVIMPKKKVKQEVYEEVADNIEEIIEDKEVLEATANLLFMRMQAKVPSHLDVGTDEEDEEDSNELVSFDNIDANDIEDDSLYEEDNNDEEDEDFEFEEEEQEIDPDDDYALEEAAGYDEDEDEYSFDDEDYLNNIDPDDDYALEEESSKQEENTEQQEDIPIDFGNTDEQTPIDFGTVPIDNIKQQEENDDTDELGLDSLNIDDMFSLGEEPDDSEEDEDDELINIDDLFNGADILDPDDDYAFEEDEDDEDNDDELNIDDMYGDENDPDDDYEEDDNDDYDEDYEEDEIDPDDDYAFEEDEEDEDDEDDIDPDDLFEDDEEDDDSNDIDSIDPDDIFGNDDDSEEEADDEDDLNVDDMYGDDEDEDDFDIDESDLTGDIEEEESDLTSLNSLFDESSTQNQPVQPQKRIKTQDKIFINGTKRGKQTQDMFNLIFGMVDKASKLKPKLPRG